MLVLSVAYPLFPVSADAGAGAEQILYLLERGLVQAGHQSIVVAAEGSQVSGRLIPAMKASSEITEKDRAEAQARHRQLIGEALEQQPIDLIHFHGLDFPAYAPATTIPMVATLHLPIGWYEERAFRFPTMQLVCVSQSQAATMPEGMPRTVIPNGVEPIGVDRSVSRSDELLWLGRICPEKGTHIALRVAHRVGMRLTVAGPVHGFAAHREYFEREVAPLLDEQRRYVGPVGREQKIAMLQRCKALLIPALAPETSSLVAMEAMSAGTPVIAFGAGALPEVVEHGVTGFIVRSEEEMAEAVGRVAELPLDIGRFSAQQMVNRYRELYAQFLKAPHFDIA